ncbi:hypothetical protein [uncultured Lactobacillus sp.]|uniref:hypothetical protein n=1 Tax=uncultured Lactobacillus sp. TaxID=153152 RepID=UPI0023D73464|nr:hypothetical protein [uncultured Lactobacillus sp.]MDE7056135.1 hypothetical protein [Lactobacillus sp.]
MRERKKSKLNVRQRIYTPKFIFGTTFIVWALMMIDNYFQHNSLWVGFLLTFVFWGVGIIAYRTTQQPGQFTKRVAKYGFFKAIFSGRSNVDRRDARARRNHR